MAKYWIGFSRYADGTNLDVQGNWTKFWETESSNQHWQIQENNTYLNDFGIRAQPQETVEGRYGIKWDQIPQAQDIDIVTRVRLDTTGSPQGREMGLALRADIASEGNENGYFATLDKNNNLSLRKATNGSLIVLSQVNYNWSVQTFYRMRFQAEGNQLRVKVWQDNESEPSSWNIETSDSSHSFGYCGLYMDNPWYPKNFDFMGVGTDGDSGALSLHDFVVQLNAGIRRSLEIPMRINVQAGAEHITEFPLKIKRGITRSLDFSIDIDTRISRVFPANISADVFGVTKQFPLEVHAGLTNRQYEFPLDLDITLKPYKSRVKLKNSRGDELVLPLGMAMLNLPTSLRVPEVRLTEKHGSVKVGPETHDPRQFIVTGSIFYPMKMLARIEDIRRTRDKILAICSYPPIEVYQKENDKRFLRTELVGYDQTWLLGRSELVMELEFRALDPFWREEEIYRARTLTQSGETVALYIEGNTREIFPEIEITDTTDLSHVLIENLRTNQIIEIVLDERLNTDQTIKIDADRYVITLDDHNILDRVGNDWFIKSFYFVEGTNKIRLTFDSPKITVKFRYQPKWY